MDADSSVSDFVTIIQNVFPDKFLHINRNDISLIFKDAPKSPWAIRTNVTNGLYRALLKKKIIIQIWKQDWALTKEVDRALLIFRELSKIDLNDKDKSEYKLIKPDLTDFKSILNKIGLNHEHKEEYFKKVTQ
jgi:hypothetical protein